MPSHRKHRGRNRKEHNSASSATVSSSSHPPLRARPPHESPSTPSKARAKPRRHKKWRPSQPPFTSRPPTKSTTCLLPLPVGGPIRPCRRVRRVIPKLDEYILFQDLARTELWLNPNILSRRKRGAVKRASRHLAATLNRLHQQRTCKMQLFLSTRTKVGTILDPSYAMNRRAKLETLRSVVEYKLLRRNHLQTLYHVSLSSLQQNLSSETSTPGRAHTAPPSESISSRIET